MKHISIVDSLRRAVELRPTVARSTPAATARKGVPVTVTRAKPKTPRVLELSASQLAAIAKAAATLHTLPENHTQPTEAKAVAASWERAMQRVIRRRQ
ncbi:hypothetical protein [Paraburkholderia sp. Ac-20347]|uniref:hypothetical protein n=1 Tax=Paraburkholderia sp. Ac-20347 TaxID=2703892 RepID=UPI00197DC894|nr:hypothetical protein [Paraburkholderia sp. Ac-20347]MBN3813657.1 hypothetical protein [Paraburkholderia sp. Ac-20347]